MSRDFVNSVFKITSHDAKNSEIGTGFVIFKDRDNQKIYLLTCAHVITSVGGPDHIRVDEFRGRTIAMSPEGDPTDLAIIAVDLGADFQPPPSSADGDIVKNSRLFNAEPLDLAPIGEPNMNFQLIGFTFYSRKKGWVNIEPLSGILSKRSGMERLDAGHRVKAWKLELDQGDELKEGYSGSPVIHQESGYVMGIAKSRYQKGKTGVAISIEEIVRLRSSISPEYTELIELIDWIQQDSADSAFYVDDSRQGVDNRLLAYRVDRSKHKKSLLDNHKQSITEESIPPIIGFIHGNEGEGHEEFLEVVKKYHWTHLAKVIPRNKRRSLVIRSFDWPDSADIIGKNDEELEPMILDALWEGFNRDKKRLNLEPPIHYSKMSQAIDRYFRCPLLIYTFVGTQDFQEAGNQIIQNLINFWSNWPRRLPGFPLIAIMVIEYTKIDINQSTLISRMKRILRPGSPDEEKVNNRIRHDLSELGNRSFDPVKVTVVDELESIEKGQVKKWTRLTDVRKAAGPYRFEPEIKTLYRKPDIKVPLENVADLLEDRLNQINPKKDEQLRKGERNGE